MWIFVNKIKFQSRFFKHVRNINQLKIFAFYNDFKKHFHRKHFRHHLYNQSIACFQFRYIEIIYKIFIWFISSQTTRLYLNILNIVVQIFHKILFKRLFKKVKIRLNCTKKNNEKTILHTFMNNNFKKSTFWFFDDLILRIVD